MTAILWWVRQVAFSLCACFFLFFAVHILLAAFRLEDPLYFIMTFLSSTFMISISGAILVGLVYRIIRFRRPSCEKEENRARSDEKESV
jgi:hypothetical protein